jgi:hypothetical protein
MPKENTETPAESDRIKTAPAELANVLVGGISRSLTIGTFCQAFRIQRRPEHWLEAKFFGYLALLAALAGLCATVPILGYPIAALLGLRLIFGGRRRNSHVGEIPDTEPYDHHHH